MAKLKIALLIKMQMDNLADISGLLQNIQAAIDDSDAELFVDYMETEKDVKEAQDQ